MNFLEKLDNKTFNKLIGLTYGEPDKYGRTEKWTCPSCGCLVSGNMKSWGWKKCTSCNKIPDWKHRFDLLFESKLE